MKTSVVILNWNGRKLLEQFLPSVLAHSLNEECDVIVADNHSSDDSLEFLRTHYPDLPVIVLDKNWGFAEGYNKALQQVDSEYVVLLNSDVETTPDWVRPLVSYMDAHPEVAAAQPKILAYNNKNRFEYAGASGGFIDRYGYPFCRGRILHVVEEDRGQYDTAIPVFWATGACLCIRRKDYAEAGGLDGRFFAHMEEIDLCWRLNARGRRVMCVPESVVYHVGGASLNQDNPKKMYLNFRNNLLMIYKNIPQRIYHSTFTMRLFFDILACSRLLLNANIQSARAVIDAYRDFLRMRPSFRPARRENLRKAVKEVIPTQYRKSILMDFYFRGKKTYASLFEEGK
ncbi:glycosyltransferase family 2 protein [Proteiniphilum sp. X52]|uniref:glycosyltransferase family 2 protein n=1 Tax=Proteiniphilum sp. X52 TaxID=2382159 RepID=UPI000F0A75C5|nr:glycosyltransferase family 2 protein [Proteiniphilum sp. X52]RNC64698.1 glycosyltransferase family 2 protein [Proteiniphilum sp. X52]